MTSISKTNLATTPLQTIAGNPPNAVTSTLPLSSAGQSTPLPDLKVKPLNLQRYNRQHIVFLRDRSTSMGGNKIDELNIATVSFGAELADPVNKGNFLWSIIDFDSRAETRCVAVSAVGLNIPIAISQGGTNFDSALKEANKVVEDVKALPNPDGWSFLFPKVFMLSDGQSAVADKNITALQEIATVHAIAFGNDADKATLSRIASDGQVESIGTEGGELRKFLAEVGKTLTQGLATAR